MPGASIEAITGRLGVGAISFLACFLIADGQQIGVYELVELYGTTASFGIVLALPTAVVTYVVGVITMGLADLLYMPVKSLAPVPSRLVHSVSGRGGELVKQLFVEHLRNYELLKGSSVAFFLLAIGCVAERPNMSGMAIVAGAAIGAIMLAILSLVFAIRSRILAVGLATEAGS